MKKETKNALLQTPACTLAATAFTSYEITWHNVTWHKHQTATKQSRVRKRTEETLILDVKVVGSHGRHETVSFQLFLQCQYTRLIVLYSHTHKHIYTLCLKNIPNIFDRNLKTNYQILIIFGKNIPDTTCHQMTIQFPTSPNVCFCTTWGKTQPAKYHFFYPLRYDCLINITRKNTFVQIFDILADNSSGCLFFNCL